MVEARPDFHQPRPRFDKVRPKTRPTWATHRNWPDLGSTRPAFRECARPSLRNVTWPTSRRPPPDRPPAVTPESFPAVADPGPLQRQPRARPAISRCRNRTQLVEQWPNATHWPKAAEQWSKPQSPRWNDIKAPIWPKATEPQPRVGPAQLAKLGETGLIRLSNAPKKSDCRVSPQRLCRELRVCVCVL